MPCSSAATSRDLPMPGSPMRTTTRPSPALACSQRRNHKSNSAGKRSGGAGYRAETADRLDNGQAGKHRAFRIILMRLREPEVDQRAIAHVAGDKAVKPSHNTPYAFLICGDDFAKILWI